LAGFTAFFNASDLALANDLGQVGKVYPIREQSLLDAIYQKLDAKQKDGTLAKLQEEFKQRVVTYVNKPTPVDGLSRTVNERTFYYDPSVTIDADLKDGNGNILYPAGTKVNPLDYFTLSRKYVFFDAEDKEQVAWVKNFIANEKSTPRLILVKGEIKSTMESFGNTIYFDQRGFLVNKFHIEQVPAVVQHEPNSPYLRIDEIRI
jgi:conjugal transfer pilus assembly protein TraW